MLRITILDTKLDRMRACEKAVHEALKGLGKKAVVTLNAEPPYLTRMNLWDRLPALDIDGTIWNKKNKDTFTADEVVRLLNKYYTAD
ncbi:MAG: hypothetical protein GY866_24860 [Proteobacteria bacterium]|nr:hypothetical protein [Pseudomonadota bacterium]